MLTVTRRTSVTVVADAALVQYGVTMNANE
jgi:hypothetical protein